MNPNTPLFVFCDCDYKGTVRVEVRPGLTERRPCPKCLGRRWLPTNLTLGLVEQLGSRVAALREECHKLRNELGSIAMKAELARLTAAREGRVEAS